MMPADPHNIGTGSASSHTEMTVLAAEFNQLTNLVDNPVPRR
jgi:hypothetical protein